MICRWACDNELLHFSQRSIAQSEMPRTNRALPPSMSETRLARRSAHPCADSASAPLLASPKTLERRLLIASTLKSAAPTRLIAPFPSGTLLCVSPESRHHQVAHLMAPLVKLGLRRLARHCRPKRNEKHAPFGAEFLILPPWMPPLAEAFGRKNDPTPARAPQRVAADLLARAHERRNTRAARPDA